MYFLDQIKTQFLSCIVNYEVSPTDGFSWSSSDPIEADPAVSVDTPDDSQPKTAEELAFSELNEELDSIENDSRLVSTYTNILWSFLVRVRNWEIEWLSVEDSDFQRLLSLYKAKFEELTDMRDRGHEIEHVISMHMHLLDHTVDRGAAGEDIDDALDAAYETEMEEREKQEDFKRLEVERDSYEWIYKELLSEFSSDQQSLFTDQTRELISSIQLLVEHNPEWASFDEKIRNLQRNNWVLHNKIEELWTYLDFEREKSATLWYAKRYQEYKDSLPDSQSINQEVDEKLRGLFFIDIDSNMSIEEQLKKAQENNTEILSIFNQLEMRESVEEREELKQLETQRDSQLGVMRELVREYQRENTSELTEWTQSFIERNVEWFNIDYPTEAITPQQKVEYLQGTIIPNLWELTIQLQIRLRDEALRVDTETLWEWRNKEVWERYNVFLETLTEAQREIIDGRSFEELWVADFQALWLDEGVDISKWFLRTESGWEITGEVWESMILSFGWNQAVDDLFPSLVPEGVNSIMVDNRLAQRVWETSFEYEWWLPVRVRDGSNIIIQNTETLSPEQETTRRTEFEQVLESNRWRQELEQQVASGLQWRWMLAPHERWEESTMDFLKRIINQIAAMFGFGEIFDMYSDEDLAAIAENGWMQRFIPNGAEILQDGEFMSELQNMCWRLGVQRDHMLVVMQAECGLNHTAVNPTSGASGLIQFMPATARWLWTTVEAIRGMSAVEQLPYVEKYFENYSGRMQSVEDIYRVVFYPAAIGKPDNWVLGSQNNSAQRVAQQNSGIARHSTRPDGLIDNNAFARYVQAKVSQFMTVDYSWWQMAQVDGVDPESLQALPENRRKVVSKALDAQANGDLLWAAHCTDWVDKIYKSEIGKSVYDASKLFDWWISTVTSTWSRDTGLRTREYAWDSIISQVQAWDHIMVDHGPGFGRGRTHSVIALETPQNGILQVVSYPNGWRPPVVELYDLTGQWRSWARPEKAMRIHTPV